MGIPDQSAASPTVRFLPPETQVEKAALFELPPARGLGVAGPESTSPVTEEVLAVNQIQGNIVPGFNKDYQLLLFCAIADAAAAKAWLAAVADEIATVAEVLAFNRLFRQMRDRRGVEAPSLVTSWANLAFSYPGLVKLTPSAAEFPEGAAFRVGMPARTALLGDKVDPATWVVGAEGNVPDLLFIVAGDRAESLDPEACRLLGLAAVPAPGEPLGATGLRLMHLDRGAVLPDKGHEHFGFKDGISQPGVRGLVSDAADDYLTPRLLDPNDPQAPFVGKPGQVLVWPGEFVLGYQRQDSRKPLVPLPALALTPDWTRNGSYLVFRRLQQDVAAFRRFVREGTALVRGNPAFAGMDAARFAAKLVGRWASGAPLARAPKSDDPPLGDDDVANNHFFFAKATGTVSAEGETVAGSPADPVGLFCPHAGHIRKVNPRDLSTESGSSLKRRLLRRGLPYGPALPVAAGETGDGADRGLLFLAYTAQLDSSFELIQQNWCNDPLQPEGGGHDPIIGQKPDGSRTFEIAGVGGLRASLTLPQPWVVPTGGVYFFAPSIAALKGVLAV